MYESAKREELIPGAELVSKIIIPGKKLHSIFFDCKSHRLLANNEILYVTTLFVKYIFVLCFIRTKLQYFYIFLGLFLHESLVTFKLPSYFINFLSKFNAFSKYVAHLSPNFSRILGKGTEGNYVIAEYIYKNVNLSESSTIYLCIQVSVIPQNYRWRQMYKSNYH